MIRISTVFAAHLLLCSFSFAQVASVRFDHFKNTGLTESKVNCLLPNGNKSLWIGTKTGVFLYSSMKMMPFFDQEAGLKTEITALEKDPFNNLWVGTRAGLWRCNPDSGVVNKISGDSVDKALKGKITSIVSTIEGDVFLGTPSGLFTYYSGSGHFVKINIPGYPFIRINVLYIDVYQRLWVGTNKGVFVAGSNGYKITRPAVEHLDHSLNIHDIMLDQKDHLWVAHDKGFTVFKANSLGNSTFRLDQILKDNPDTVSHQSVRSVVNDHAGFIWLGTNTGLYRIDNSLYGKVDKPRYKRFYHRSNNSGILSCDTINDMVKSGNGAIWIATDNGLNRLNPSAAVQAIKEFKNIGDDLEKLTNNFEKLLFGPSSNEEAHCAIHGQIYFSENSPAAFVSVSAIDPSGHSTATAMTDKRGRFEINNLRPDGKYSISMTDSAIKLSKNAVLYINNSAGEHVQKYVTDRSRHFTFTALPEEAYLSLEPIQTEDPQPLFRVHLNGQVYQELPGDYPEGLQVYVLNDSGEVVFATITDEQGNFKFEKLPPDLHYIIRLQSDDPTLKLTLKDDQGNPLPTTVVAGSRSFLYNRLPSDAVTMTLLDENDVSITISSDENFVIGNLYYQYNQWALNNEAKKELNKLVDILKKNKHIKVLVSSHTDDRGSDSYNLELSAKRAVVVNDYLLNHGITPAQVETKGYGESKPVIPREEIAKIQDEAEKEQAYKKNRRTEFRLMPSL